MEKTANDQAASKGTFFYQPTHQKNISFKEYCDRTLSVT